MNKVSINSFDVLKLLMAIMIIQIHAKALYPIVRPFRDSAVPVFFVLSSFFFFRKAWENSFKTSLLIRFLKRITIMYVLWFFINIYYIYTHKNYFDSFKGILYLTHDVLFNYTFPGSWFLSALAIAVILIYITKQIKLPSTILFIGSFLLYFYLYYYQLLPDKYQIPYNFFQSFMRPELALTFLIAIPWCSLGLLLSSNQVLTFLNNKSQILLYTFSSLFISLLIVELCIPSILRILNPLFVISLLYITYHIKLPESRVWIYMRNCSILFYFLHFMVIRSLQKFTESSYTQTFILVCIICSVISCILLLMEKNRFFHFLSYLH